MEGVSQLTELAKYGTVGIILALIGLVGLIGYFFWKFACNHTEHSNEAFNKVTEALTKNTDAIESLKQFIDLKIR